MPSRISWQQGADQSVHRQFPVPIPLFDQLIVLGRWMSHRDAVVHYVCEHTLAANSKIPSPVPSMRHPLIPIQRLNIGICDGIEATEDRVSEAWHDVGCPPEDEPPTEQFICPQRYCCRAPLGHLPLVQVAAICKILASTCRPLVVVT